MLRDTMEDINNDLVQLDIKVLFRTIIPKKITQGGIDYYFFGVGKKRGVLYARFVRKGYEDCEKIQENRIYLYYLDTSTDKILTNHRIDVLETFKTLDDFEKFFVALGYSCNKNVRGRGHSILLNLKELYYLNLNWRCYRDPVRKRNKIYKRILNLLD